MNKRLLYIFSFIFIIIALSSCQTQRARLKKPIKLMGADHVLEKMRQNQSAFNWYSGKAKVDFIEGKKKTALMAQVRIKYDSVIWVSISNSIGIEGARLLLTQDSVKYLNRIDKTYFEGDYVFLSNILDSDIDFSMIQALLTAKDFSWYDYQDLKAKLDNRLYQLESTNRRQLKKQSKLISFENPVYYQSLWINPETFKIERIKIKEIGKEKNKIIASYKQYKTVDKQRMPYSMDIELDSEKGMSLEMEYYKINLDEVVSFPFSISKKYTLVEL